MASHFVNNSEDLFVLKFYLHAIGFLKTTCCSDFGEVAIFKINGGFSDDIITTNDVIILDTNGQIFLYR